MKAEIIDLARHRIERAKESFKDGELLLAQGSTRGAISRFYYAAFHASRALLATKELDSSRHTGVITLFSKHFVKEGIVFPETAKALSRSFEKRLDSDYEDYVEFNHAETEIVRNEVADFVNSCQQILEQIIFQRENQ